MLIWDTEIIVLFLLLLNGLLLFFFALLREEESVIFNILAINFDILGSLPLFPIMSLWAKGRLLILLIQLIILAWRTSNHLFTVRPPWTILLVSKLVI